MENLNVLYVSCLNFTLASLADSHTHTHTAPLHQWFATAISYAGGYLIAGGGQGHYIHDLGV